MLRFHDSFFQEEERENFIIDATMKTVWATELEILNEISIICDRHNLDWYMGFGSLLGTIRHQGFIPWDDDMDICLKRADYNTLLTVLQEELPEGYVVKSPMLEDGYPAFHTLVSNSDSISVDPEHLRKFHNCPFIVGIDIFPLDDLNEGQMGKLQKGLFGLVRQGALMAKNGDINANLEEILKAIEEQCDVTIGRECFLDPSSPVLQEELASGLWGLANEVAMLKGEENPDKLVMYLDYFKYGKVYEKTWFNEIELKEFEGFQVPVPCGYDRVLKVVYGDYNIRYRSSAQHDYPFYKKQLEYLRKLVQETEERQ